MQILATTQLLPFDLCTRKASYYLWTSIQKGIFARNMTPSFPYQTHRTAGLSKPSSPEGPSLASKEIACHCSLCVCLISAPIQPDEKIQERLLFTADGQKVGRRLESSKSNINWSSNNVLVSCYTKHYNMLVIEERKK